MVSLNRIFFSVISVNCIFFLSSQTTFGSENKLKKITVCSEAGYVPFEMIDPEGHWDGYEVKIIEKFAENNNYKLQLKNMAYDGLIPSLVMRKNCDLIASTLAVNVKRGKTVEFSKPILITYFSALIRINDKDKFDTFDKINKKTTHMAVQNGTEDDSYVNKYAKNVTILGYSNNIDPVIAVLTNKADIYIEDINYLRLMQRKYPGKFVLIDPKMLPNNPDIPVAFAFRKSDMKLISEMNKFLDQITQNGELFGLKKKYFEDLIWKNKFPL